MTEKESTGGTHGPGPEAGDRLSVIDRELIDRYLAGRLDAASLQQVEARIVADPVFRGEVELTEGLRSGLKALERRGGLAEPARPPLRFWQQPAYALAASVAAVALGLTSFALLDQLRQARSATQLLHPAPASGVRVLTLARSRGADGTADLTLTRESAPTLLELRLDPGPVPAAAYRVGIERIDPESRTAILTLPRIAPTDSGELVVELHSAMLPPGEYAIGLIPEGSAAGAYEYRLRVER